VSRATQKASRKLLDMLNQAVARELQVSIQYMYQHIQAMGISGATVEDTFKQIAITEMKHAEQIGERLWYLGGTPTTKPDPINVGASVKEMLQFDVKAEEEAISLYKAIIRLADSEGDDTTRLMFEDILEVEEEHHDTFTKLLKE